MSRTCSVRWGHNLLGWDVSDIPPNPVSAGNCHIKEGKGFSPVTEVRGWTNEICDNFRKILFTPKLVYFKESLRIYLLIFSMMLPKALVFKNVYEALMSKRLRSTTARNLSLCFGVLF